MCLILKVNVYVRINSHSYIKDHSKDVKSRVLYFLIILTSQTQKSTITSISRQYLPEQIQVLENVIQFSLIT